MYEDAVAALLRVGDLDDEVVAIHRTGVAELAAGFAIERRLVDDDTDGLDRKSTRLNSSHMSISYAVFCLKKKKKKKKKNNRNRQNQNEKINKHLDSVN